MPVFLQQGPAVDFDLSILIPWTRNACGDRPRATRESLVGTGEATLTLSNTGGITLGRVTVDGEEVEAGSVTVDGNVLTFAAPPDIDADVTVNYGLTRYTDADLRDFLSDAAATVAADLPATLAASRDTGRVEVPEQFLDAAGATLDVQIQKLLVYRAALDVFADKANQAADDAITIRDGDTTIDTSKSAQSSEAAMRRLTAKYDDALRRAKLGRLRGAFNAS